MSTQLYFTRAARRPDRDLRDQLKVCPPKAETTINIAFDVRRNKYGSIDVNFYRIRGLRLRREAMVELARSIPNTESLGCAAGANPDQYVRCYPAWRNVDSDFA